MSEPRVWTLTNPFGTGVQVDGPEVSLSEEADVVEAERVADLLERIVHEVREGEPPRLERAVSLLRQLRGEG